MRANSRLALAWCTWLQQINSFVSASPTRVHSLVRKAGTFELCFILFLQPLTLWIHCKSDSSQPDGRNRLSALLRRGRKNKRFTNFRYRKRPVIGRKRFYVSVLTWSSRWTQQVFEADTIYSPADEADGRMGGVCCLFQAVIHPDFTAQGISRIINKLIKLKLCNCGSYLA